MMTGLTLIATMTGDAEDLLFILYFEPFPEHWPGETEPLTLLGPVPHFAALPPAYPGRGRHPLGGRRLLGGVAGG